MAIVTSAAYSPDGTRIVTASDDKTARIWDAVSGFAARVVAAVMAGIVASAAYSPDGTRIVTASIDKTARIWDARTDAQLAVLCGHGDFVIPPPTRPTAAIVTASFDQRPDLGCAQRRTVGGAVRPWRDSLSAAYSPDSTRIVTASSDKTALIWDARTGAQLLVLSGHGGSRRFPPPSRPTAHALSPLV